MLFNNGERGTCPCCILSVRVFSTGSRSDKGVRWGYQPTWTQEAPQSGSPLRGGNSGEQLSSRPWASCGAKSGERRPQAQASGRHGNEPWNATVVALFLGTSGLPVLLLQVNVHSKGGTPEENNHSLLPFTIAFPPYQKEKKKEKKTACLKETTGSFWCNLGATILGSGFLFRDLFASCKSLAALTLNLMTFHVFVVLLLHQF